MRNRVRLCSTLAFLAIMAVAQAQSPAALRVPYRLVTLDNGLTVILHQDKSVPVASVNVWYHVGSANEKPGRTGFAHLFEHLMFEGSKNVPEGQFEDRKSTRLNSSHLVNSYAAFCLKKKHNR